MVCTANDLHGWKDFPKGLTVLLLDGDSSSAAEIKTKLEEMEYVVVTYCNENDALSAISSKPETFHVAIVEVTTSNHNGNFKFLEAAKDLPTIMISNIHCLNTMMKCIALGAIEFLQKPLSEDKLRNIWQHVVHKAFNAGGNALPGSLKPIKESVASMLHLEMEISENQHKETTEFKASNKDHVNDCELPEGSDKYPAPSTPQQEQGTRLVDDGDCQDQTNCSLEKECGEHDGESKSVETTCIDSLDEDIPQVKHSQLSVEEAFKEEDNSADGGSRALSNIDHELHDKENISSPDKNKSRACGINNPCGTKVSRKRLKVDWTSELHKKFVRAVEQLGVNQAIPSRILELMKVEGLTRHNVASHLQKYRMHKRHILPKEDGSLPHSKVPMRKNYYPQRPVMAFPSYHSNHALPVPPMYPPPPPWGHMACPSAGVQMWVPPSYPPWQPPKIWPWKSYPGMHADAWGCPVTPPPHSHLSPHPQHISQFDNGNAFGLAFSPIDLQLAEEEIDKVVKEAMNKPWLPLPLGLKPPSTESVLYELSRQGISTVPSHINGSQYQ